MKKNIFALCLLIILGALTRLIPHGYNFTPIAGMALLGGAYFHKKILAFLVPLATLYLSDFVLNNTLYRSFYPDTEGLVFYSNFMIFTYIGTALIVLLGIGILKKVNGKRLLGSAIIATLSFFIITNFGTWASSPVPLYPMTLGGLMASYIAGLPFLSGHLLGNLLFTFVLFSAYEFSLNRDISKVFSFK